MGTDSLQIFNKNLAKKLIESGAEQDEIWESCFTEDEIYLDYYGCLSHLDGFGWENTISSLEILPNEEDEETFILLQPIHIDKIIESLRNHTKELTIMSEKEIDKIVQFKTFCAQNQDFMVAYMLDF